ncbi:MAG: helix-turn-helix transcriptional regulator [Clostridia bacterium]|nr:helix-turn-helix transcriptional regulator [Clostridia bacterium]
MRVATISRIGIYDSTKQFSSVSVSPERTVHTFELDYILSCSKTAVSHVDGESFPMMPGMLILRKPGQKSFSELHFRCYCLYLEPDEDSPFLKTLWQAPSFFPLINEKSYRPIFEALHHHLLKHGWDTENYFVCAKLLELLYLIGRDSEKKLCVMPSVSKKEGRAVQAAIAHMEKNYAQSISLESLGAQIGYSPNHFQKIFSEVMGASPQKYLEDVRIKQAKYLLAQNDKTLSEIALECGFSSQSYFSKVFKKHVMMTPGEFQKRSEVRLPHDEEV